ncbi:MAG: ABC transporter permease subunit [Candidatus Dormibacteria bacterium]
MQFRSVYAKTLRDYRIPILGWGLGMGLIAVVTMASVGSLVTTPEARAALASLAVSLAWAGDPVAVDTVGGYTTWKVGLSMLLIALWPLLAASRMLRGEEERGSMDVLLSLPRGRTRMALEKVAAMWTALLAMGLLIGLLAFAGGERYNAGFGLGGGLLFGLNLTLICAVFGSIALLISQFTRERRTAAGVTGGLLLVFIVVDMIHRVTPNTEWISRLSPVYYYNLSKPLVRTYGANAGAMAFLLGLSLIVGAAGIYLFARRDVGGTPTMPGWLRLPSRAPRDERPLPIGDWSLRSVYARSLGMIAFPTLWWALGIAGYAGLMVPEVHQLESKMAALDQGSPLMKSFIAKLGGGDIAVNATLLSAIFFFLPVVLMAFAVTQANRWSADEEDGRLELVLATPQPRVRVLMGRFGALTTATVFIGVMTLATTASASAVSGVKLDGGNLAGATLGMIPLGLLVAAIGYLFSGWLRTAVDTGLLSFLVAFWFLVSFIGPELNWPDAALRLSAFYYYGTPLVHGLAVGNTLLVVAAGMCALTVAAARFARKDLGR